MEEIIVPIEIEIDELIMSIVSKKIPNLETTADVLKHSVSLGNILWNEISAGNHIMIADKNSNLIKELKLF